jgi:hypothetical protein
VERYEALSRRGATAPRDEQDRLRALLRQVGARTIAAPPRRSPADSRGVRRERPAVADRRADLADGRAGRQEALF